jgi:hypothetical protein
MRGWLVLLTACASGPEPVDAVDTVQDTVETVDTVVDTVEDTDAPDDTVPRETATPEPCALGLQASQDGVPLTALELGATAAQGDVLSVTFTLHNPCDTRLRFLGHPDDWLDVEGASLGELPPVFLEPGASAVLRLDLVPGEPGEVSGRFRLPYDLPGSPLELPLTATVGDPLTVVFVGDGRHVVATPDYGASFPVDMWETTVAHGDALQRGVCHGAGRFLSVGGNVDARWWTSADGDTWAAHTDPDLPVFSGCGHGDGWFVVAAGGRPYRSVDGLSWEAGHPVAYDPHHLRAMTWSDGVFLAVGDGGRVRGTTDGLTWSLTHLLGADLGAVAGHGGTFVAVGAGGTVATSTDHGTSWTTSVLDASVTWGGVVWAQDRFVIGGGGQVYSSPDGLSWTFVNSGPAIPRVAVGAQVFGTGGGAIHRSTDGGFSWTELHTLGAGLGVGDAVAGAVP